MKISKAFRTAAAGIGLLAAAALPAIAQTAAPAEAPQQTPLPKADPAKLKAAMDLLTATNADAQFAGIIPDIFRQLRAELPASAAAADQKQNVDQVFAETEKQFAARRSELLEQIASLYASKFSIEEMKGLADFYRTPLGQKFVATTPSLASEALRIGDAWEDKVGSEAEARIRDELQKRGVSL
ncbi:MULTISPECIES: DUF2059 domain-containing protein [Rhodomicrobium]|uniref:DUF2059 domain-containing protein n=1 Tax=Rhodomicrobium TaxID=1068 RepID=UPI000B4A6A12|nr:MULTISPECIES: DUF2059 domain-containing protein [Rhodomicrobium]